MSSPPKAAISLSEDDICRSSSQFKHWTFTSRQLEDLRRNSNEAASATVRDAILRSRAGNGSQPGTIEAEIDYLTPAEEQTIVKWYCNKAMDLCDYQKQYGFGKAVKATAVQFLNRFYLNNSPMTYHPKKMMLSAIYLATKIENMYLNVEEFAKMVPKTTADDILAPEFLLAQGLRFTFDVRHPFRALEGGLMEMRAMGKGEYIPPAGSPLSSDDVKKAVLALPGSGKDYATRVETAYAKAGQLLLEGAQLTDAYFLYTPAQILMAAWLAADRSLAEIYLHVQLSSSPGFSLNQPSALELRLKALLESCAALMSSTVASRRPDDVAKAEAIRIDKKLYKCRNPEKVDIAGMHRAAKEKEDDDHKDKKRKLEREAAQKEGEKLFGGNLKT